MATLHQQYTEYNGKLKLTDDRKGKLRTSRTELRKKIRTWFTENKPGELQPKFGGQGSFMMDTTVNPIPKKDAAGSELRKYDLDDGIYFIEKEDEDNRQSVSTWRDWVHSAVDGHTATTPERHKACIRVIFSDGHHIDLPIYYKETGTIELAHRDDGWIKSDPKAFCDWFNNKAKNRPQLKRIVRYLKGWKNFQEEQDSANYIASGFSLTILATNNYQDHDNDDVAFRKTVAAMKSQLDREYECLRPTTPVGEDVFNTHNYLMKTRFIDALNVLRQSCEDSAVETNQRTASEIMRAQLGTRFALAADIDESRKSQNLAIAVGTSSIPPRGYAR